MDLVLKIIFLTKNEFDGCKICILLHTAKKFYMQGLEGGDKR